MAGKSMAHSGEVHGIATPLPISTLNSFLNFQSVFSRTIQNVGRVEFRNFHIFQIELIYT